MNRAKRLLKTTACIKLLEDFRQVRSRKGDIFVNLNRLIDEYLRNHDTIHPMFVNLIEDECQDAVFAREMTQDEMHQLMNKISNNIDMAA